MATGQPKSKAEELIAGVLAQWDESHPNALAMARLKRDAVIATLL